MVDPALKPAAVPEDAVSVPRLEQPERAISATPAIATVVIAILRMVITFFVVWLCRVITVEWTSPLR